MTWHTPCRRRILIGAEAVLLKESIATLADMLSVDLHGEGNVSEMGVAAFDCLTGPARLNLLARVAVALLTSTAECAPLTAVSKATISSHWPHQAAGNPTSLPRNVNKAVSQTSLNHRLNRNNPSSSRLT